MKLINIFSDRYYQTWPSWHIVYEWENELSVLLNLPIKNSPITTRYIHKKLRKIEHKLFKGELIESWNKLAHNKTNYSLYFEMHPKQHKNFSNYSNTVPVIIDYWERSNVEQIRKMYKHCPYLLITSKEALHFLEENQFKNKLIHFPLSLPSKYKLNTNQTFDKKYDIVLAGRNNAVLWKFLKQYEQEHPEIEYLYQTEQNRELYYVSNKNGIIGKFHSREDYINLMKSARISFYSTPGIDGGELRTNGFNPVTPKFFEMLSAGCHVLARYPKNAETDYFELDKICSSINSYSDFEHQLNNALKAPQPVKRNAEYLLNHYTSTRIEILKNIQ